MNLKKKGKKTWKKKQEKKEKQCEGTELEKSRIIRKIQKDNNIEIAECGIDYIIFRYKDSGAKFVCTLLSGNVPKSVFRDSFEYYKDRIDSLDPNSNDFYDNLNDRVLNRIPTKVEGLEPKVYRYLNKKFGREELEKIIRRCRRFTLKQQVKKRGVGSWL